MSNISVRIATNNTQYMKHRFLCNHVYSSLKTYDIYSEPLGLHRILSILRIHVYIVHIYIHIFKLYTYIWYNSGTNYLSAGAGILQSTVCCWNCQWRNIHYHTGWSVKLSSFWPSNDVWFWCDTFSNKTGFGMPLWSYTALKIWTIISSLHFAEIIPRFTDFTITLPFGVTSCDSNMIQPNHI